ncbi:hypothetical protein [Sessilibacter sp. MAH4]
MTKSRPLEGCDIDIDGCDFYFADAYISLSEEECGSKAVVTILDKVEKALQSAHLELVEVKMCARFFPEEWVDQTDSIDTMHSLANRALETEDVVFSSFRTEEIQELYQYHHPLMKLKLNSSGK